MLRVPRDGFGPGYRTQFPLQIRAARRVHTLAKGHADFLKGAGRRYDAQLVALLDVLEQVLVTTPIVIARVKEMEALAKPPTNSGTQGLLSSRIAIIQQVLTSCATAYLDFEKRRLETLDQLEKDERGQQALLSDTGAFPGGHWFDPSHEGRLPDLATGPDGKSKPAGITSTQHK